MVMTTNRKNGYFPDRSNVDNCLRASPEPGPFLRCPVSTPLNSHRPIRQKIPESLTFVSLDFSKVKSFPKIPPHRGPPGLRTYGKRNVRSENQARRKNFDYYYVDKAFQNKLAAHSNTSWLRSLCSQPVREIFNKYKRHGEMLMEPIPVPRSYSTPGERSILDHWDLNSRRGRREKTALSVPTKNNSSNQDSTSPELTIISRSCTTFTNSNVPSVPVTESKEESLPRGPTPGNEESDADVDDESFARPTPSPQPIPTPRASPIKREQMQEIRLPIRYSPIIDETIYEDYERKQVKFPDIHAQKPTANLSQSKSFNIETPIRNIEPIEEERQSSPVKRKSSFFNRKQKSSTLHEIKENIYNFG